MKFSTNTKTAARLRQKGRCGICGEKLDDLWEEAHHLRPHSMGGRDHVDNCVILCDQCHHRAHYDGRYRNGFVAPRSYFRYFNG